MDRVKDWFPFSQDLEGNKESMLVFCFHHAGGSASIYKKWTNYNADNEICFVPVELPGKGCRAKEEYIFDMEELTTQLAYAITAYAKGRKYILYGHSMGAAIAFKTAYQIEKNYEHTPIMLLVSGRHSPCVDIKDRYQTDMDDSILLHELEVMGGTPKIILENKEIMDALLPFIKNDYKLNESFQYQNEIIHIPIYAFAGSKDADATIDMLDDWDTVTTCSLKKQEFPGEHFFIFDLGEDYIIALKKSIKEVLDELSIGTF